MDNYDKELLDEINTRVDLLEYVMNDIELKKRGRDYFGRCPLHIDKNPSFSINPNKNFYYCFSCGNGGGIIQYINKYEGLEYEDAINKAMSLAGIDGSKICRSNTITHLKNIRAINRKQENEHHEILDKNIYEKYSKEPITEWLSEGIEQYVLDLFEIRIDRISNRIVYPVYDENWNLINIKGRTRYKNFDDLGIQKYMNYYKVQPLDYFQGFNITKDFVYEKNEIIIFESIKSVMKAYGWGYKNCVSAEGHVFSKEQIKMLIRLKCDVVLAFDKDVDLTAEKERKTLENVNTLKRFLNVSIINDDGDLLGDASERNSPADLSKNIWELLYLNKSKL